MPVTFRISGPVEPVKNEKPRFSPAVFARSAILGGGFAAVASVRMRSSSRAAAPGSCIGSAANAE